MPKWGGGGLETMEGYKSYIYISLNVYTCMFVCVCVCVCVCVEGGGGRGGVDQEWQREKVITSYDLFIIW